MKRNRLGTSGIVVADSWAGTVTFATMADQKTSFEVLAIGCSSELAWGLMQRLGRDMSWLL